MLTVDVQLFLYKETFDSQFGFNQFVDQGKPVLFVSLCVPFFLTYEGF